ncbi:glycyl radical protein [Planctomycetota bacterium]
MEQLLDFAMTERIQTLKQRTLTAARYLSLEQAKIITQVYQESPDGPVLLKRAKALARALEEMPIAIDPEELIVGNRTPDVRAGVVFPEAGIGWLEEEIETLPTRPQDTFQVHPRDIDDFRTLITPYWRGKTLEDDIYTQYGPAIKAMEKVVKINQKDHAQGHICPHVKKWLDYGPSGLLEQTQKKLAGADKEQQDFYQGVCLVLKGAIGFIKRYAALAEQLAQTEAEEVSSCNLRQIADICHNLAERPPGSFHEALQSVWFLFVILHMESNASSFSPGRMDQYLYPYYKRDRQEGGLTDQAVLELIESLWIKFNQIVYLRNAHSARYFAGFPIGFNVAIGGQTVEGADATNALSYLFLMAQEHIGLPQPNLSARLHQNSPDHFVDACTRVIGLGSGMPQIFNDESIIPALTSQGISREHAMDYAVVGCVELTTQGNNLGWSDAAMFNLVKVLELTLNNGRCMLTDQCMGLETGHFTDFESYADLEQAYGRQIGFFVERMIQVCEWIEQKHQEHLPSPFLSTVVDDCLERGLDVTAGGAHYNLSGIQAIQVANVADSLAVLKQLVYKEQRVSRDELLTACRENFNSHEILQQICLHQVPKYGNDTEWVDQLGAQWLTYFADQLKAYTNVRGGPYHMGLYTVSAHVPMGQNVAATPDGRLSGSPLADGGMSPMYGRDCLGPTAVLRSVARAPLARASNGTLLNMKFLPVFFKTHRGRKQFSALLKAFVCLRIHHVQFNVLRQEDLLAAQQNPEAYQGLTVRVAGYTAYFTELAEDLQDEIIARTTFGE